MKSKLFVIKKITKILLLVLQDEKENGITKLKIFEKGKPESTTLKLL